MAVTEPPYAAVGSEFKRPTMQPRCSLFLESYPVIVALLFNYSAHGRFS
jgi:hypothetical protein